MREAAELAHDLEEREWASSSVVTAIIHLSMQVA